MSDLGGVEGLSVNHHQRWRREEGKSSPEGNNFG